MKRTYRLSRKYFSFYSRRRTRIKYPELARIGDLDGSSRSIEVPAPLSMETLAAGSSHSNRDEQDGVAPDANSQKEEEEKIGNGPNRPKSHAIMQQRCDAWEPILSPATVLPSLLILGLVMIPIGAFLLVTSNGVDEIIVDYTDCPIKDCDVKKPEWPFINQTSSCTCKVPFTVTQPFERDVFVYYGLTNYFQSARRYAKSMDLNQLTTGRLIPAEDIDKDCEPLDEGSNSKAIAPCGFIANSLFNDTFKLFYVIAKDNKTLVPMVQTDIAWPSDRDAKYKNPANLSYAFDHFYDKPPNWKFSANYLDPDDSSNNGFYNEHLMVWLRVAAFATFRKFYGRIYHRPKSIFRSGIPTGQYYMEIQYNYPVTPFKANKIFIITNTSWLGGRTDFLGIAYIVTGSLILVLTGWLFYMVRKHGKSQKEVVAVDKKTPYFDVKRGKLE